MNGYLLQNPEELKQLLIKYRVLMAEAGFTVDDLLKLTGTGVQELTRFRPEVFFHDYVGQKNLLPNYAQLVLNVEVLNRGVLRDVLAQIAALPKSLTETELAAKMLELDSQYRLEQLVAEPNQFATQFKPFAAVSEETVILEEPSIFNDIAKNRNEELRVDLLEPLVSEVDLLEPLAPEVPMRGQLVQDMADSQFGPFIDEDQQFKIR